jgi:hypothetical protein
MTTTLITSSCSATRTHRHCNNSDNIQTDDDCPICLSPLPSNKGLFVRFHKHNNIKYLNCCGNACCKRCLKDDKGEYQVDWCPLCRAFLPHYQNNNNNNPNDNHNVKKKYQQAHRLVTTIPKTATINDCMQQGIRLLQEILQEQQQQEHQDNNHTNISSSFAAAVSSSFAAAASSSSSSSSSSSIPRSEIQMTLARALYKTNQHSIAMQILQNMIDEHQQQHLQQSIFPKRRRRRNGDRKRIAQAHFLLAQILEKEGELLAVVVGEEEHERSNEERDSSEEDAAVADDSDANANAARDGARHDPNHHSIIEPSTSPHIYNKNRNHNNNHAPPQYHYDQAVLMDPGNISLLVACAQKTVDTQLALHYHQRILQINKYHVPSNLWVANYYQHHLQERTRKAKRAKKRQSKRNNNNNESNNNQNKNNPSSSSSPSSNTNISTTSILLAYLACIVRAEYRLSSNHHHYCQQQQQQQLQQQQYHAAACQAHRDYLQNNVPLFYQKWCLRLDRVSAAFVQVIAVQEEEEEQEEVH